ncbi:MAG: DNA mismatch repair protein MutS [Flavobacterium sp.]|nr:MAG: DNA mismatch repair protein MutS [Flavobacterium sp.]
MKKGDKVEAIDDEIKGVILEVISDTILILTEDDFEMQFDRSELVVIPEDISPSEIIPENFSQILSEKQESKAVKSVRVKPKMRKQPAMEVDLHIDKLVKSTKHLTNHDMLTIQIDTAKRQLDFAIRKKIQRIVFIHGVGDGVLRAEMEYLFRRYDNVKYYDADLQKYGRGATEVYIFQNTNP